MSPKLFDKFCVPKRIHSAIDADPLPLLG